MKSTLLAAFAVLLVGCPGPAKSPVEPETESGPERTIEMKDGHLVLPGPIVFDYGAQVLDEQASDDALRHILAWLRTGPEITKIRIEGHTDGELGADEVAISGESAYSVGRWLRDRGIDCERMIIAAFGATKPVADGSTPEGRAQNRRVEIVAVELRGTVIGGLDPEGGALVSATTCQ